MSPEMYIFIGSSFVLLMWTLSTVLEKRYYIRKSRHEYRTPVCIGKGFYYIVPEDEYIELDLLRLWEEKRGE